ncbi:MAG: hypothetical protein ACKVQA_17205 [Burkholderiales bacterium]
MWTRKLSGDHIKYAGDVYGWEDIDGTWIEFDAQGRMTSFGDRNITMATAVRDGQGRITRIRDHNDLQVLTFEYTGANRDPLQAEGTPRVAGGLVRNLTV